MALDKIVWMQFTASVRTYHGHGSLLERTAIMMMMQQSLQ